MSEATWDGGIPLTKSENAELRRLNGKHRDIRLLGSGALEAYEQKQDLQRRRQAWVTTHRVSCFGCGMTVGEWAKLGVTDGRRWAICSPCVRKPKAKGGRIPEAL